MNQHGTCGHCGGPVTTPSIWMGIHPPTPTCQQCGRVPLAPFGPVIPMGPKPKPFVPKTLAQCFGGIEVPTR